MAQNHIRITGLDEILSQLGSDGRERLIDEIDDIVERKTFEMINAARMNAPRLTGKLANSIDMVDQETAKLSRTFGSDLPYATRQEYEHATHKGYMRRAVWSNRNALRDEINDAIKSAGG